MAKIAVSGKTFERWFKKNVTKPLLVKIDDALSDAKEHAVDDVMRDSLDTIHHELPAEMYAWITSAEANIGAKGAEKYINVVNQLANWLLARGFGFATPLLVPTVESSVRRVYKASHLESIFDKLKIEDNVEAWLGFTISSNNDEDDAKDEAVPAPVRTPTKTALGTGTSAGTGDTANPQTGKKAAT